MQLYIRRCFIICMCKLLVQNFIIKDILKKKNVVHLISVPTITKLAPSRFTFDVFLHYVVLIYRLCAGPIEALSEDFSWQADPWPSYL